MKKYIWVTALGLVAVLAGLGCQKDYHVGPLSVQPNTPTMTPTSVPCGYPGDTCTFTPTVTATVTRTVTNTATPSSTPTITLTLTITNTPTVTPLVISAPQGVTGFLDIDTGYPNVEWAVDQSAAVTAYQLWYSTTGTSGSYTICYTAAKPAADTMAIYDGVTTFNFYFYVVAIGTLPDSALEDCPRRFQHDLHQRHGHRHHQQSQPNLLAVRKRARGLHAHL